MRARRTVLPRDKQNNVQFQVVRRSALLLSDNATSALFRSRSFTRVGTSFGGTSRLRPQRVRCVVDPHDRSASDLGGGPTNQLPHESDDVVGVLQRGADDRLHEHPLRHRALDPVSQPHEFDVHAFEPSPRLRQQVRRVRVLAPSPDRASTTTSQPRRGLHMSKALIALGSASTTGFKHSCPL